MKRGNESGNKLIYTRGCLHVDGRLSGVNEHARKSARAPVHLISK